LVTLDSFAAQAADDVGGIYARAALPLLDRIQADENVPVLARQLFAAQAEKYAKLQTQIAEVDAKLMAWHKADECNRRLAKIPGVGPIGAALLMMKTPTPEMFRSGRQFAAWIGLTPKHHSTAGKVRQGQVTKPCAAC
jgi:transposase